jgi:hypothetical protein
MLTTAFDPLRIFLAGYEVADRRGGEEVMALVSLRAPIAGVFGATAMALRAFTIAPEYTAVKSEMGNWALVGALLVMVGLFWELVRWYQRMDRRYLPDTTP